MTEPSSISKVTTPIPFYKQHNEDTILNSRRTTIPVPFNLSKIKSSKNLAKITSNNKKLKRMTLYCNLSPAFRTQTNILSKRHTVCKDIQINPSERTRELINAINNSSLKPQVSNFCHSQKLSPKIPLKTESKWFPKVKVEDLIKKAN